VGSAPNESYLNASWLPGCWPSTMNTDDRRFLEQVGDRIRERRLAAGLTQAQLAEKCGLHRTFIGSVERGERNLALLSLRRIAAALRSAPAELLTNPARHPD
jgi:ribosome-binding protein aMBF1 (putative translation factor)